MGRQSQIAWSTFPSSKRHDPWIHPPIHKQRAPYFWPKYLTWELNLMWTGLILRVVVCGRVWCQDWDERQRREVTQRQWLVLLRPASYLPGQGWTVDTDWPVVGTQSVIRPQWAHQHQGHQQSNLEWEISHLTFSNTPLLTTEGFMKPLKSFSK